ncbi:MAG TPA: 30S ribosomal protein S9 [Longilinea sp.]|nr:30S ribosomal protein S9 [Longilinea sp.]
MSVQFFEGVGRRKEATARVRLMTGTGQFTVNDRPLEDYFPRLGDMQAIFSPIDAANMDRATLDCTVVVHGGGVTGQTDAVKLGVARALLKINPENRPALREAGLLTRDSRIKERKKPGLKRARKAPTYTKR